MFDLWYFVDRQRENEYPELQIPQYDIVDERKPEATTCNMFLDVTCRPVQPCGMTNLVVSRCSLH